MSWIRAWLNNDLYHFSGVPVNAMRVSEEGKARLDNSIGDW
jgi:hypothetical protein